MELDQLRNFIKIAETQNMTKAGGELGLSQSALSRSLQRLETELGRPLFERQTRKMVLTDTGKLLHEHASRALAILDDVQSVIEDDGRTGRLRVGAIPTIAPYYLPQLLSEFGRRFPHATVAVHEDVTQQLIAKLQQGELDVAVLALPIGVRYLSSIELFTEPLWLVVGQSHPLAKAKQISMGDIEHYPFVLLGEAHCLSETVVSYCRQRSIQPVATERTSQLATVQELVALGHGVSLVPRMAAEMDESPRRVYRPFEGTQPQRTVGVVWNPYRYESRLQVALIELMRETADRRP